ncbi:MAG: ATP-binding protein [Mesorhizobium sp.]|uniref:AAA family ATPase n=1 Tax=Mesorhizobium sp. TaxID=1871066 RepID=UPI001AC65421|nr:ATP-binding protein [Mesorhizobium sp.]MBN9219633.1 ATP-binding protein [Mesorhizobium sp.]
MSNAKQILAMLKSRSEGDDELFFSIALQVAAAEARQGHRNMAEDMRAEIEKARASRRRQVVGPIAIGAPRGELQGLLELRETHLKLKDVVLDTALVKIICDVVRQQRRRDWLREHGKKPSRRLLFVGPPGSGKTMTAEATAGELNLPLFVIRLEQLISRYMGDTAAKLRLVFDQCFKHRGVYLFDEFDALGAHRTSVNDVAEMRRVLNSFLQFMEEDAPTDSLIICATNHPALLDRALLRRYDQVLEFRPPTAAEIKDILVRNLRPMKAGRLAWGAILKDAVELSQAELVRAADDAVKTAILDERNNITTDDLLLRLQERRRMRLAFLDAPKP